jgi:signal transduction histidine kinase
MKTTSISRKLLSRVLSVYFILTFIVTCGQIVAEYFNTKSHITNELLTLEKTFTGSLTRAVWELNTQQAVDIAEGLIAIPMIQGISVTDENGQIIAQLGRQTEKSNNTYNAAENVANGHQLISSLKDGLFGHSFPLIFEFSGRTTRVGTVELLSSNRVIFDRIEVGIYFLIGNAMIKTAFLVFLFMLAFNRLLTTPLQELTDQIKRFDIDDPEVSKLHSINYERNELSILEDAYNNLIDELMLHKEQLNKAQNEIIKTNQQLDEQNILLEQEVAKKTSSLSSSMLELQQQKQTLMQQQKKLQEENVRRSQTEKTLIQTNKDLRDSVLELKKAQNMLLTTEKMASLGSLSAEISHEINTPIGVSITSTTYLDDLLKKITRDVENNKLSKRSFIEFSTNANHSIELLLVNLNRASDLITSFKQVAVDQTSNKLRKISLAKYLNEIIQSLAPKLKKTAHTINVNCDENIIIYTHAGAIAQIITNLIINSILHAFDHIKHGEITINISMQDKLVHLHYHDNGQGIANEKLPQLFDPFYTTKASSGGTGLGTHIIYNLVTDTLNGSVEAHSELGKGLSYDIKFLDMSSN